MFGFSPRQLPVRSSFNDVSVDGRDYKPFPKHSKY